MTWVTWRQYRYQSALAGSGVAAEQVIGVLAHPAQPPDRYALLVQRGPGQIPQLAGERAHAAVHVLSIGPLGVPQRASAPRNPNHGNASATRRLLCPG